ncbi:hypothetical protein DFH06DRAFT_1294264 [Mycena polygramma]|nr:hypothetical protein DFH06DRAFT_1294264 [Mycena polygramma]
MFVFKSSTIEIPKEEGDQILLSTTIPIFWPSTLLGSGHAASTPASIPSHLEATPALFRVRDSGKRDTAFATHFQRFWNGSAIVGRHHAKLLTYDGMVTPRISGGFWDVFSFISARIGPNAILGFDFGWGKWAWRRTLAAEYDDSHPVCDSDVGQNSPKLNIILIQTPKIVDIDSISAPKHLPTSAQMSRSRCFRPFFEPPFHGVHTARLGHRIAADVFLGNHLGQSSPIGLSVAESLFAPLAPSPPPFTCRYSPSNAQRTQSTLPSESLTQCRVQMSLSFLSTFRILNLTDHLLLFIPSQTIGKLPWILTAAGFVIDINSRLTRSWVKSTYSQRSILTSTSSLHCEVKNDSLGLRVCLSFVLQVEFVLQTSSTELKKLKFRRRLLGFEVAQGECRSKFHLHVLNFQLKSSATHLDSNAIISPHPNLDLPRFRS